MLHVLAPVPLLEVAREAPFFAHGLERCDDRADRLVTHGHHLREALLPEVSRLLPAGVDREGLGERGLALGRRFDADAHLAVLEDSETESAGVVHREDAVLTGPFGPGHVPLVVVVRFGHDATFLEFRGPLGPFGVSQFDDPIPLRSCFHGARAVTLPDGGDGVVDIRLQQDDESGQDGTGATEAAFAVNRHSLPRLHCWNDVGHEERCEKPRNTTEVFHGEVLVIELLRTEVQRRPIAESHQEIGVGESLIAEIDPAGVHLVRPDRNQVAVVQLTIMVLGNHDLTSFRSITTLPHFFTLANPPQRFHCI